MRQVLSGFETTYEDANIWRRDRRTTVRIHADAAGELPNELLARIKPRIEEGFNIDLDAYFGRSFGEAPFANHTAATIPIRFSDLIPLKDRPGYYLAWGGEEEDSAKAKTYLATSFPIFIAIMVVIVITLFNAVREPLIIWLTVPLSIIGVTVGLLMFNQPFGFMALLGLMSLTGMLIKNAIVLMDEINLNLSQGKRRFWAVVDAGVSRMRPVMMAAATTILGMIPLLTDAFFVAMAVTIMVGLLIATVLTLVVCPYSTRSSSASRTKPFRRRSGGRLLDATGAARATIRYHGGKLHRDEASEEDGLAKLADERSPRRSPGEGRSTGE